MVYILILSGIFLIVLGILIKYFKFYWLISGYNTMSKEKRKNVDTEGLGRFMGNFLFLLGGIITIGALLIFAGYKTIGIIITTAAPFILTPYMIIKAQKYDKNALETDGSMNKSTKLIIGFFIGLMVIILIFITCLGVYGSQEPQITVKDEYIRVGGMYSSTVHMEDIKEVVLLDSIPRVIRKDNGFDFGNILKGKFNLEYIGKGRLYINNGKPPYVYLKLEKGYVIINFRNGEKTKELYNEIRLNITRG